MAKLSKRRRAINEKVEPGKVYQAEEALSLLKELSSVKFSETVDVAINLGIDSRKSDQVVRACVGEPFTDLRKRLAQLRWLWAIIVMILLKPCF